jgi:hypothetical protein
MAVLARRRDAVRPRFSGFLFPGTPTAAAAATSSETTSESFGPCWSRPLPTSPSFPDDNSSAPGRRLGLGIALDLSFTIIYGIVVDVFPPFPLSPGVNPSLVDSSPSMMVLCAFLLLQKNNQVAQSKNLVNFQPTSTLFSTLRLNVPNVFRAGD